MRKISLGPLHSEHMKAPVVNSVVSLFLSLSLSLARCLFLSLSRSSSSCLVWDQQLVDIVS